MKVPRQVSPAVAALIQRLPDQFRIAETKSYFFLYDGNTRVQCIGSRGSKSGPRAEVNDLTAIRRYCREKGIEL